MKTSTAQRIQNELSNNNGNEITYEVGKFKMVKNSNTINAVIKSGAFKIVSSKKNENGGFDWVDLKAI